jgi:hypothetical protein
MPLPRLAPQFPLIRRKVRLNRVNWLILRMFGPNLSKWALKRVHGGLWGQRHDNARRQGSTTAIRRPAGHCRAMS